MDLDKWAMRWGVNAAAVMDLKNMFGLIQTDPAGGAGGTGETEIQTQIRLEASQKGMRLFRNNVGATHTDEGGFIRYGLANDSALLNKRVKSSDLIGIRPIVITHEHLGHKIGQFVAREVKAPGWKFRGNGREAAQLAFIQLVSGLGGDAAFTSRVGDL